MLDIAFIRQNADAVRAAIKNKRLDLDLDQLLAADKERREITASSTRSARARTRSGALIPKAPQGRAPQAGRGGRTGPGRHRAPRAGLRRSEADVRRPDAPRPERPAPGGARRQGRGRQRRDSQGRRAADFDFEPKDHVELMTSLRLVNWDGPRKFAGRSLVRADRARGVPGAGGSASGDRHPCRARDHARLPAGDGERARDDRARGSSRSAARRRTRSPPTSSFSSARARSPSSRCTATRRRRRALPIRYAGISPCFRREAGAHGKDTEASTACTSSRRWSRWSSARRTRRSPRRSTTRCSGTPRRSWQRWRSRTASRSRARAKSGSGRRASTRSSRGCRGGSVQRDALVLDAG